MHRSTLNNEVPRCWIMALLAPHMVVGCNCNEAFSWCTTWGGNRYFGSLWTRLGQPRFLCNRYLMFEEKGGIGLRPSRGAHGCQCIPPYSINVGNFAQFGAQFTKDVIEGCHCEPLWTWHWPMFQTWPSDCHGSTPTCLRPAIHQDSSGVVSPHEMNLAFSVRATGRCTVGGNGPTVHPLSDNEVWMHRFPRLHDSRLTRHLSHYFLPVQCWSHAWSQGDALHLMCDFCVPRAPHNCGVMLEVLLARKMSFQLWLTNVIIHGFFCSVSEFFASFGPRPFYFISLNLDH